MARHSHSQSVLNTTETPTAARPEGFMSMAEVDAAIKRLNKTQRRLSRHRRVSGVADLPLLTPDELCRLTHLIAGRLNIKDA